MKTNYLCKDCKHCFVTLPNQLLFAFHDTEFRYSCRMAYEEKQVKYNPVTGGTKGKAQYKLCTFSRADKDMCGPDAKYWTPKNKKHLFLALSK